MGILCSFCVDQIADDPVEPGVIITLGFGLILSLTLKRQLLNVKLS